MLLLLLLLLLLLTPQQLGTVEAVFGMGILIDSSRRQVLLQRTGLETTFWLCRRKRCHHTVSRVDAHDAIVTSLVVS